VAIAGREGSTHPDKIKDTPFYGLAVRSVDNINKAMFIFSTIKFVEFLNS
jgi:hypothetical protein